MRLNQVHLMILSQLVGELAFAVTCPSSSGYIDKGYADTFGNPFCVVDSSQLGGVTDGKEFKLNLPLLGTDAMYLNAPFQCGKNRISLLRDRTATTASATFAPFLNETKTVGPITYEYFNNANQHYAYPPASRCMCLSAETGTGGVRQVPAAGSTVTTPTSVTNLSKIYPDGTERFPPDTWDMISSQMTQNSVRYSPVPIDRDPNEDPRTATRLDTYFMNPQFAFCGCPNLNEASTEIAPDGADPVTSLIHGSTCGPMVSGVPLGNLYPNPPTNTSPRVLAKYFGNEAYFHTEAPQILTNWSEPLYNPDTTLPANRPISSMRVRTSDKNADTTRYDRRIWTCAAPYRLNLTTGVCEYVESENACDDGTLSGSVSPYSGGLSTAAGFNNLVNKKLACCTNQYSIDAAGNTVGTVRPKFDCYQNTLPAGQSFDQLWASSDTVDQGQQLNALLLRDSSNRILTGFFTLNGDRCNQFSEFSAPAGGIQRMRVDPLIIAGQQNQVGAPVAFGAAIPIPTSPRFAELAAALPAGVGYPTTANDFRSCPILVRAAMTARCPSIFTGPPNFLSRMLNGTTVSCANASSVQIHIRIEQIFEITGMPVQKTIDSTMNAGQAADIDISKIISTKYLGSCPPGQHHPDGNASVCQY